MLLQLAAGYHPLLRPETHPLITLAPLIYSHISNAAVTPIYFSHSPFILLVHYFLFIVAFYYYTYVVLFDPPSLLLLPQLPCPPHCPWPLQVILCCLHHLCLLLWICWKSLWHYSFLSPFSMANRLWKRKGLLMIMMIEQHFHFDFCAIMLLLICN